MASSIETTMNLQKFICIGRFAYDVIVYSATRFGVQDTNICKWEGEENDYFDPEFIKVISRIIFKYQITQRLNWGCIFFVRYFITEFKSFADISEALHIVMKFSKEESLGCVLYEVMLSLAVVCELILFLYTNGCDLHVKELVSTWEEYFFPIRGDFENAGGLIELHNRFNELEHLGLDLFYSTMIPQYCIPYNTEVFPRLLYYFYKSFDEFFKVTAKTSSLKVFDSACETFFLSSRTMIETKEVLKLSLTSKSLRLPGFLKRIRAMKIWVPIPPPIHLVAKPKTKVKACGRYTTQMDVHQTESAPYSDVQDIAEANLSPSKIEIADVSFEFSLESSDYASYPTSSASTSAHNIPDISIQDIADCKASNETEELKTQSSVPSSKDDGRKESLSPSKGKRFKESESVNLGINLTRESLQDINMSMASASTSSRHIADTSFQDVSIDCKKSPVRVTERKRRSSLRSSVEDPEQETSLDCKKSPIQAAERKRKYSLGSNVDDFEQESSIDCKKSPIQASERKRRSSLHSNVDLEQETSSDCKKSPIQASQRKRRSSLRSNVDLEQETSIDCKKSPIQTEQKLISSLSSNVEDIEQEPSSDCKKSPIQATERKRKSSVSLNVEDLEQETTIDCQKSPFQATERKRKSSLQSSVEDPVQANLESGYQAFDNSSSKFEVSDVSLCMPRNIGCRYEDENRFIKRWLLHYWYIDNPLVLQLMDPIDMCFSEFDVNEGLKSEIEEKIIQSPRAPERVRESNPGPSEPQDVGAAVESKNSTREEIRKESSFLRECETFMEHLLRDYLFYDVEDTDEFLRYKELHDRAGLEFKPPSLNVPGPSRKRPKPFKPLRL